VHTAASMAAVAGFAAVPGIPRPWPTTCAVVAALVLAIAVVLTASPALHRRAVVRRSARAWVFSLVSGHRRRLAALVLAALVLLASVLGALLSGTWDGPATDGVTGLSASFWMVLAAVQVVLLAVLAFFVVVLHDSAADRPYLGGFAAPVMALLAVVLGGLLSAVVAVAAARTVGVPVPADHPDPAGVAIAPVLYAFASAPWGLLAGAVVVASWLWCRFRSNRKAHAPAVAIEYGEDVRDRRTRRDRDRIASAWAVGDLADDAGPVLATVTVGGAAAVCLVAVSPLWRASWGRAGCGARLPPALSRRSRSPAGWSGCCAAPTRTATAGG
jgi:hypothetical protein